MPLLKPFWIGTRKPVQLNLQTTSVYEVSRPRIWSECWQLIACDNVLKIARASNSEIHNGTETSKNMSYAPKIPRSITAPKLQRTCRILQRFIDVVYVGTNVSRSMMTTSLKRFIVTLQSRSATSNYLGETHLTRHTQRMHLVYDQRRMSLQIDYYETSP